MSSDGLHVPAVVPPAVEGAGDQLVLHGGAQALHHTHLYLETYRDRQADRQTKTERGRDQLVLHGGALPLLHTDLSFTSP